MTGVFYETLEYSVTTARLVEHEIYLRHRGGGWMLSTDKPTEPYYVIYPNGDAVEVTKQ